MQVNDNLITVYVYYIIYRELYRTNITHCRGNIQRVKVVTATYSAKMNLSKNIG